jgi:hypothetical protein
VRRNENNCANVLKECVKPGNRIAVVVTAANPAAPRTENLVETAVANPAVTTAKHPTTAPVVTTANPAAPRMAVPVETAVANPAVTTAKHPTAAPVVTTANQADPRMAARISNMAIPLDHRTVAPAAIMESPPMASPTIIQGVTMDQKTVIPRVVGMTNTAVTVQDIHGVLP